jgi:hypothetical protein
VSLVSASDNVPDVSLSQAVLSAVTHNGRQLLMTALLMLVTVYLYTLFAYNFFRDQFTQVRASAMQRARGGQMWHSAQFRRRGDAAGTPRLRVRRHG